MLFAAWSAGRSIARFNSSQRFAFAQLILFADSGFEKEKSNKLARRRDTYLRKPADSQPRSGVWEAVYRVPHFAILRLRKRRARTALDCCTGRPRNRNARKTRNPEGPVEYTGDKPPPLQFRAVRFRFLCPTGPARSPVAPPRQKCAIGSPPPTRPNPLRR